MNKWVYKFSVTSSDGSADMKNLLGGKGANLAEMTSIGISVPPGFTITTECCIEYYRNNSAIPDEAHTQITETLKWLEQQTGKVFGGQENPLLVSVRSGARSSMPGMMDTILNVGLNDTTVEALAKQSNNRRFAYDSYRRLIEMYSDVVLGFHRHEFEGLLQQMISANMVTDERELTDENLYDLVQQYKETLQLVGLTFPQDPQEQLWNAINAVFKSWMNERAIIYRKIHNIPEDWGTAVTVQSMVFGNYGSTSATGVCFTRNPSTGEKELYGEYLTNAQGEDIVAGIRTPQQITLHGKKANYLDSLALEEEMPSVYKSLLESTQKLEAHFRDMQDIEFTIENGQLFILQTRNGKRSARSAVKVAYDLHQEDVLTKSQAVMRVSPSDVDHLLHPSIDSSKQYHVLTTGLPASPGAAFGMAVFSAKDAENLFKGQQIILVRAETSPEDIGGMHQAAGIVTARGGMTSHAAVVARGMGKPCVVGASKLMIDEDKKQMQVGSEIISEGDIISINGATGDVIKGKVDMISSEMSDELKTILSWCDELKTLGVRANADTPQDAKTAKEFGAIGIGLCRTEHMFFKPERLISIRKLILATSKAESDAALSELFEYQKSDFCGIFGAMESLPITIRLLDPPLHEFLPRKDEEFGDLSSKIGMSVESIRKRVGTLIEANPMLGHRGVRLAISNPEIYEMQVRAILEAAIETKFTGDVEIMIPLVQNIEELQFSKDLVDRAAAEIFAKHGKTTPFKFGTMIELPKAALEAKSLATLAEFFSFGTNDLTQTTLGLSRDDSARFIDSYYDNKIFKRDPFATIDVKGVGELVNIACERGRAANSNLKLGICGEHGGDPESINFFHKSGLNYVSCSPFRVPVARLAAAQAKISGA